MRASQLPTRGRCRPFFAPDRTVAGGRHEAAPTDLRSSCHLFWWRSGYEEEELESLEPLESLLDDCVAIVPHFNESISGGTTAVATSAIIAFSDQLFYARAAFTRFHRPLTSTNSQGSTRLTCLMARPRAWKGPPATCAEARVAAQTVLRQLERFPERSVGVVAMGINQKEAIEDALGRNWRAVRPPSPLGA